MWLVAALMAAPACTCYQTPSGGSASSLCPSGGSCGSLQCDFATPCPDAGDRFHTTQVPIGFHGACVDECEPEWFDCNGDTSDGCESNVPCPDLGPGPDSGVTWLQTLSYAPLGLALCGDEVVYVDGNELIAVPVAGGTTRLLASLNQQPAGGIACDHDYVYVPIRSSADGGADGGMKNGRVSGFPLKDSGSDASPLFVANATDPARSIEVDDAGGVYWLTRTDGGTFVTKSVLGSPFDASAGLLLPIDEPQVYKTFALNAGLWAIGGGDVRHLYSDAAVDLIADANAVSLTSRASGVAIFDGIDGGARLLRDAGSESFFDARATASWGDDLFVATDHGVVHVPPKGVPLVIASNLTHVVDLAVDAKHVYFTTIGPPAALSRVNW